MRIVTAKPCTSLRRRIALAAAQREETSTTFARRLIDAWVRCATPAEPGEAPEETRGTVTVRYTLGDTTHRQLRLLAATWDVSLSVLVVRILHASVPYEVEILADILQEGA